MYLAAIPIAPALVPSSERATATGVGVGSSSPTLIVKTSVGVTTSGATVNKTRGPEPMQLKLEGVGVHPFTAKSGPTSSIVAVVPEGVAAAELAAGGVSYVEVRPHDHRVVTLRGVRDVAELVGVADLVRCHGLDVVCVGGAGRRPLDLGAEPDVRLDRIALLVVGDERARERLAASWSFFRLPQSTVL